MCQQIGRVTAATVVDHIVPHQGNKELFWDRSNWQPLCAPCHDRHKRRQERSGTLAGCTTDGTPLDPGHHWNRG
ncbi:MAG TPA: HNH endonuclease signature motif containing protein [Guyparkeria sp.]|nr:HNH endonuclease signature motif containing protein [Guyparkeria sp.]